MRKLSLHRPIGVSLLLWLLAAPSWADCNAMPSRSAFFAFIKTIKTQTAQNGETILKAEAGNTDCQGSFTVKVLDAKGRVLVRVYNAQTSTLIHEGFHTSSGVNATGGTSGSAATDSTKRRLPNILGAFSGSSNDDDDNDSGQGADNDAGGGFAGGDDDDSGGGFNGFGGGDDDDGGGYGGFGDGGGFGGGGDD